ncbi:MAG: hypothetical protein WDN49_25060 [Acetobacteraceae bacterium]
MKINFFSPLPPLRTEIGNHTLTVAAALREVADLTLWTPQAEPPTMDLAVPVVRYDPTAMDWPRLNRADVNVYNIGNNATFHSEIFNIAGWRPASWCCTTRGCSTFFARYSEKEGPGRDFYRRSMRESHGPAGLEDADRFLARELPIDALVERYPMTLSTLHSALCAVVHNVEEQALAKQTRTPVFHLPLALRRRVAASAERFGRRAAADRVRLHRPEPAPRQHPGGAGPVGGPGRPLDIYGALDEPAPVDEAIAILGLGDRVVRHGFVDESGTGHSPGPGGSGDQPALPLDGRGLRQPVADLGCRPALAGDAGRAGMPRCPADAVFFVEPEREVETICLHLAALRRDPARFRRAGLRGREVLLERHTPAQYADGLVEIARQIGPLHRPADRDRSVTDGGAEAARPDRPDGGRSMRRAGRCGDSCVDPGRGGISPG